MVPGRCSTGTEKLGVATLHMVHRASVGSGTQYCVRTMTHQEELCSEWLSIIVKVIAASPVLPPRPQSLEVVLYYKASHTSLDGPTKEEEKEEKKEETKEESQDRMVSEPSGHQEVKFKDDQEEKDEEVTTRRVRANDQEEEDDEEASEGKQPLKLSESKKVTIAEG